MKRFKKIVRNQYVRVGLISFIYGTISVAVVLGILIFVGLATGILVLL